MISQTRVLYGAHNNWLSRNEHQFGVLAQLNLKDNVPKASIIYKMNITTSFLIAGKLLEMLVPQDCQSLLYIL